MGGVGANVRDELLDVLDGSQLDSSRVRADANSRDGLAGSSSALGVTRTKAGEVSGGRAQEGAVLVASRGLKCAHGGCRNTRGFVRGARHAAALGRAKVARHALNLDGLLIRFASVLGVTVVGGVGADVRCKLLDVLDGSQLDSSRVRADANSRDGLAGSSSALSVTRTKAGEVSGGRAQEGAVLVASRGLKCAHGGCRNTRGFVRGARHAAALGRAKVARHALNLDGLLIRFASVLGVTVVGGVGANVGNEGDFESRGRRKERRDSGKSKLHYLCLLCCVRIRMLEFFRMVTLQITKTI